MTSEPKLDPPERDLERVRAAFRAAEFDDEPPPEVDAAILAAAAAARGRRLHGYLPPLALAATVVLALGLALRLAVPTREPVDASLLREADEAPSALEVESLSSQAADDAAEARRERAVTPGRASVTDEATSAPATAMPQAPPEEGVAFSRTPSAAVAADSELENGAASRAIEALVAPAAGCETALRAAADDWLACIAMLIDAGNVAAARAELERFTASYPNSAVPATIAERVAP